MHATSLASWQGRARPPPARALAERLVTALVERTLRWEDEGRGPLLDEIRAACATIGQKVGWDGGEGLALDVADDGALVVGSNGERRRVVAGDVRIRL